MLIRYADRPDLRERRNLAAQVFPEFLSNNDVGARYWPRLYSDFPAFQLALLEDGEPVAEGHALPIPWDGTAAGLPSGWDAAFEQVDRRNVARLVVRREVNPKPSGRIGRDLKPGFRHRNALDEVLIHADHDRARAGHDAQHLER